MASILDIAKKAGVSHGTVSNVLNKKGNVSAEKIKLVEEAAEKLNYFANAQAKTLRKGTSNQIALVVSSYDISEYTYFYRGMESVLSLYDVSLSIYEAPATQEKYHDLLVSFGVSQYSKIITMGVTFSLRESIRDQFAPLIVSFEDYLSQRGFNVIDEIKAHVGLHLSEDNNTLYLLPSPHFIRQVGANTKTISFGLTYEEIKSITSHSRLVFITSLSYRIFFQVMAFHGVDYGGELVYFSEEISDRPDVMILANFHEFGRHIANDIVAKKENSIPQFFSFPKFISNRKNSGETIKLISNNNPTVQALSKIVSGFYQQTGVRVELTIVDHDEIYHIINSDAIHDYDFIRIDLSLFPYYSEKLFLELDHVSAYQGRRDIFDKVFEKVVGNVLSQYGVPFDTSIQTMFYRSDIFENELFKRIYFEKFKRKFKVPSTIQDYIIVCRFIAEQTGQFSLTHGNAMNLADPNVISSEFLLIYYGLGGHLVSDKGVSLNPEIAFEALKYYYELSSVSLHNFDKWFDQGIQDYGEGRIAMIFGYSNQLSHIRKYKVITDSKVTKVPGNMPMLGGGVLAQIKKDASSLRNETFLDWFLNPYTKFMLSEHGGIPANEKIIAYEPIYKRHGYLLESLETINQAVRETFDSEGNPMNIYKFERRIGELIQHHFGMEGGRLIQIINEALEKL